MLAATTCSSVNAPATLREKRLRRGKISSIVPLRSPSLGLIATQSPTAASSCRPVARCRMRPECCACSSPSAVTTRKMWLYSMVTRAGVRPARAGPANAAAHPSSHPNSVRLVRSLTVARIASSALPCHCTGEARAPYTGVRRGRCPPGERMKPTSQLSLFEQIPDRGEHADAVARQHAEALPVADALPAGVFFGTSSWSFPGWAGIVYSKSRSTTELAREGLAEYARHPLLTTVGIDRSYYAPIPVADLQEYAAQLPPGFRCCFK